MRAARYRAPRALDVVTCDVPSPGPADVLLEVSHCGICGTDLHLVLDGMGRPGVTPGHEYSGRIAALGSEVEGFRVGEEVVGGPRAPCRRCAYCLAGRPSLCEQRPGFADASGPSGAFAQYARVAAADLVRVPTGVPLREAALAEPLAVALHAVARAQASPGERVLVTGAGPLGLLVVAVLQSRGVRDIVVSEPSRGRAERALRVGASRVVAPDALSLPVMPFDCVAEPFHAALECSGNPLAMEGALAQLRRAGRLVLIGTGMRRPQLDHNRVLLNELVVTGAFNYDADGFPAALALIASGTLPMGELVEPTDRSLDGLFAALEALERGELTRKVLVAPTPPSARKEAPHD